MPLDFWRHEPLQEIPRLSLGSTSLESSSDSFSLELLVPPSSSDIRISRDSKKLILDFPSNQLSFRRFDRTNLLNRLLLGFGIGGAAYVSLVYTYLWVSSLGLSQTSAATLLLCVGFSLYFCFVYLSSRKSRASLGFFEDTVWIKMPHKKIRSFTLKEVWKFQRGKQNSIRISIGDWRTILYTSRAEQDWLIQILENRIGLPESELAAGSLEA